MIHAVTIFIRFISLGAASSIIKTSLVYAMTDGLLPANSFQLLYNNLYNADSEFFTNDQSKWTFEKHR